MTAYLIEREAYGRKETIIDVERFAADLAASLGSTVEPHGEGYMNGDWEQIKIGALMLSVYANRYGGKGKVHVTCSACGIPPNDHPYPDSRGTYKMPEAHVNPERPMAVIAKDIKRRVIDAAAEPLANTSAYVARRAAERQGIAEMVAQLQAGVPEMRVRDNGGQADNSSRTIDWSGAGACAYLTARIYADGGVRIDRIGTVPLAAFVEIAAVLRKHAKQEGRS